MYINTHVYKHTPTQINYTHLNLSSVFHGFCPFPPFGWGGALFGGLKKPGKVAKKATVSKSIQPYRMAKCNESLNLLASFLKRATNDRALLRKITYKDQASYASSPPCSLCIHTRKTHTHAQTSPIRNSRGT